MKNHCNDSASTPYLPGRFHAEANGVFILWEVRISYIIHNIIVIYPVI